MYRQLTTNIDFSSVSFQNMGAIAARINRETGDLIINPNIWNNIPDYLKRFIELHEWGHYVLKTDSEILANRYATKNYVRSGHEEMDSYYLSLINGLLKSSKARKLKKEFYTIYPDSEPVYSDFLGLPALIGGVLSIGSSIIGKGASDNQADAIKEQAQLDYKIRLAELEDLKRQQQTQYDMQQNAIESKQKSQTQLLVLGSIAIVVIIGLLAFLKKTKK